MESIGRRNRAAPTWSAAEKALDGAAAAAMAVEPPDTSTLPSNIAPNNLNNAAAVRSCRGGSRAQRVLDVPPAGQPLCRRGHTPRHPRNILG